jgi:large subunit ribosomal protein L19
VSRDQLVDQFEATNTSKKKPSFKVGDTVKVSTKIVEGEKERIQAFTGVVISRKGIGNSETFTVYRNAYGSSMERVFLLNSPRVADVEVIREGNVCKSKLYFLRGQSGKKAKIKEKIGGRTKVDVESLEPLDQDGDKELLLEQLPVLEKEEAMPMDEEAKKPAKEKTKKKKNEKKEEN